MGVSSSKRYSTSNVPIVLPSVSRITDMSSGTRCSGLSGVGSLSGSRPPYRLIYEWQEGLPDIRSVSKVPDNDIVSDGEAEGLAWDLSLAYYENLATDKGEKVRYVSAVGLKTPDASFVPRSRKNQNRNECCC
ncbi:uncharacterized protein TM35_000152950 [Trypanosoma theileri]|uniref:Uncharacterized protein n=1 Tax=Trypanosoma theileri TaxID=67003 RepID=A0A1X0NVY0_9TRYP|nr:uncharacterized protein TM35_000152950 [Trypanosoma theileri]ORC88864.1 hypothetical protein TM35_000152950 [Trypanosoma theileri]